MWPLQNRNQSFHRSIDPIWSRIFFWEAGTLIAQPRSKKTLARANFKHDSCCFVISLFSFFFSEGTSILSKDSALDHRGEGKWANGWKWFHRSQTHFYKKTRTTSMVIVNPLHWMDVMISIYTLYNIMFFSHIAVRKLYIHICRYVFAHASYPRPYTWLTTHIECSWFANNWVSFTLIMTQPPCEK